MVVSFMDALLINHTNHLSDSWPLAEQQAAAVPEPVTKVDLDKDIIRPLIAEGKVSAYHSTEYVKDMGTPERYGEVTEAVRSGFPGKKTEKPSPELNKIFILFNF